MKTGNSPSFKKLIFCSLAFIFLFGTSLKAQVSQGGQPYSFTHPDNVPEPVFEVMPAVDLEQLMAEDQVFDQYKSVPWRFGENITVDLGIHNAGTWTELDETGRVWQLGIQCPGALSINLTFDAFYLPAGASLFVYRADRSIVLGAFTSENNDESRVFATTLLRAEAVILEYFEPTGVPFPGSLHLARVTHGYRDAFSYAKNFGTSGSCNNNVACPESAGWENQIRSACMLVVGGNGFCSGALVNNTLNNGTPYVLTANHCSSSNDFASWVFWFNWQSPTCANPTSSPAYQSISGSTLKARNSGSDFCLVQMNNPPPASYNTYYSGWDNSDASPTRQVCIHHPDGDIKKISFDNNPATAISWGSPSAACWQIGVWDDGTTEPGSSGAPLYDQNNRIIGQLFGGYASCTSLTSDYFGRFGVSWNTGLTAATRLRDWLDPGNTGLSFIDGYDTAIPVPPVAEFTFEGGNGCSGTINFINQSSGSPTSWLWDFGDGNTSNQPNPTHIYTQNGLYSVSLVVTNGLGSDTLLMSDTVSINMPMAPVGVPASTCLPGSLILSATGNGILNWYDAPTGGNPLDTGTVFTTPLLDSSQTFWVGDEIHNPPQFTGKPDNSGGGGYYTQTTAHYLRFDVTAPCRLVSVKVYAGAAGNRVISLLNSSGTVIHEDTIAIPQGESRITLNYDLQPGNGFRLRAQASPNLFRNNAGVTYPYTLNGLVSVVGSSATTGTIYYFFYDWEIVNICHSPRTPVEATILSSELQITEPDSLHTCEGLALSLHASGNGSYLWSDGSNGPTLEWNPALGNQISLITTFEGCTGYDTVDVVVHPYPVANAGSDQTICPGESATLSAGGGSSYLWNTGSTNSSIVVSPPSPTIYSVTVTESVCSSTDAVAVDLFPAPNPALGNDTTVCTGSSTLVLSPGTGFAGYHWSDGTTSPTLTVSSPVDTTIIFGVTVTNAEGCTATDQITVFFSTCGGMAGMPGSVTAKLYPQPSGGSVTLQMNGVSDQEVGFRLMDSFGRTVQAGQTRINAGTAVLAIQRIPPGLYVLSVSTRDFNTRIPVVRE